MAEVLTPVPAETSTPRTEEPGLPTYTFKFSDFLRREYRFGLSPDRPICRLYQQGHCPNGSRCPDKHHVASSFNKYAQIICATRLLLS